VNSRKLVLMFAKLGWCCTVESLAANQQVVQQPNTARVANELMGLRLLNDGSQSRNIASDTGGGLHMPREVNVRGSDACTSSTATDYVALDEEQKVKQMLKLQDMVKSFVREMLQGVLLDVVLEDGSLMTCRCRMDNRLVVLSLQVREVLREIRMLDIQEVCSGDELERINTTTPLDDLCVTLVMVNDQCVSFKFRDTLSREHFATSLKILRLALD